MLKGLARRGFVTKDITDADILMQFQKICLDRSKHHWRGYHPLINTTVKNDLKIQYLMNNFAENDNKEAFELMTCLFAMTPIEVKDLYLNLVVYTKQSFRSICSDSNVALHLLASCSKSYLYQIHFYIIYI